MATENRSVERFIVIIDPASCCGNGTRRVFVCLRLGRPVEKGPKIVDTSYLPLYNTAGGVFMERSSFAAEPAKA